MNNTSDQSDLVLPLTCNSLSGKRTQHSGVTIAASPVHVMVCLMQHVVMSLLVIVGFTA